MNYYGSSIKLGSKNNDAKKWQEYLKDQGYYSGSINGIFDSVTEEATKGWQKDKELTEDGIVSDSVWSAAGFTPYKNYSETEEGINKKAAMDTALGYLTSSNFNWDTKIGETPVSEYYNSLLQDKLSREPFEYDINTDELYKQYAAEYSRLGRLASEDAMGQAAALTGGYGNSYAATIGAQAYNTYMQQLADKVPDLYQIALNNYIQEGNQIDSQISTLNEDYSRSLAEWQSKYGTMEDKYGYLNSDYAAAEKEYNNKISEDKASGYGDVYYEAIKDIESMIELGDYAVEDQIDYIKELYSEKLISAEEYKYLSDYIKKTVIDAPETQPQPQPQPETQPETQPEQQNSTSYKELLKNPNNWEVVNYGGANLFGIDEDAVVKDPNGKEWTLEELKEKLMVEGMSSSEARAEIKKFQQYLDISSNWFFGL